MRLHDSKNVSNKPKKTTTRPNITMTGTITEAGGRHIASVSVPKGEFEQLMTVYWLKVKDKLNPNLLAAATKGGYREVQRSRVVHAAGGVNAFFSPVALEVLEMFMEQQDRKGLVVRDAKIIEGLEVFTIEGQVYLEPLVTWKGKVPGIDEPLKVKIPKMPPDAADRMVDEEIRAARHKSAILTPVTDLSLSPVPGQVVVVDVQSLINGEKWEEGSSIAKKWPMDAEYFKIKELYTTLLEMKPDDRRSLSFTLPDTFGDNAGKKVDATITLIQVFNKAMPEVDDDLAKSNGFDTLAAWKTKLIADMNYKIADSRVTLVDNEITAKILNTEVVDVEPVPQIWMAEKAREIFSQARSMVASDEEVISQFKAANLKTLGGMEVTDRNTVLVFLAEKATQQLVADLVFKSWGKLKGIEGSTTLEELPEYVKTVSSTMKAIVDVEEYEIDLPKEQK